jgi:RNA polymerase sigma-70 factor (TIGR02960 family)
LEAIVDLSPGPEDRYQARETIELAFIAALQHLPPRRRAVLVLRDVLGFHTAEVADILGSTDDSVKGALKRARAALEQRLPAMGSGRPPEPSSPHERELVRRFVEAYEADDIDGLVALLTDDAWYTMPPVPLDYQGPTAIAAFLRYITTWRGPRRSRLVPTRANTQPAFGVYAYDQHTPVAHATGLLVLTLQGDRISVITRFFDTSILTRFGLPRTLPD